MHIVTFEVVSPTRPAVSLGLLSHSYFYFLVISFLLFLDVFGKLRDLDVALADTYKWVLIIKTPASFS